MGSRNQSVFINFFPWLILFTYSPFYDYLSPMQVQKDRSSLTEKFCKNVVLRNSAKFTGKQLCQSLIFKNVADLRPVTLLRKKLSRFVFSCGFCEISKNTFSYITPFLVASKKKTGNEILTYKHKNETPIQPVQQKQLPRQNLKNICFRNASNIHGKCSRITTGEKCPNSKITTG